jgi:hypothetical protein
MQLLAADTQEVFGQWTVDTADATQGPVWQAVAAALDSVGINELQTILSFLNLQSVTSVRLKMSILTSGIT